MFRRHLSYANVVATVALVFAMSGGALAAAHYLITSTSQIKPSVLRTLKPRITTVESPMTSVQPDTVETVPASCPSGSTAVGGGGLGPGGIAASEPTPGNRGWFIIVNNLSPTAPIHVHADAECMAG